jgi:TonB family protein
VPAEYTDAAKSAGFHGKVSVIVSVDEHGVPQKIEPVGTIPFGLEQAVDEAIRQWRFRPASAGGVPVESNTIVNVPFR